MNGIPLVVEKDLDDPDCATVLVDGSIAGRSYRFVLDTGAARTHVVADDELARLPKRGKHQSAGVIGTRDENLLLVPELTVGTLTWTGMEISSGDAGHPGARNLLGMDAIGTCAGRFDFVRGIWEPVPTGIELAGWPLHRSSRGHILMDVVWPGTTAHAYWDSGAGISVVDSGFLARHPDLFQFAGTSTGTDATGANAELPTYWVREARIGDRMFERHRAVATDLPQENGRMDMILGYPALRQVVWMFDFPTRRWTIECVDPPIHIRS